MNLYDHLGTSIRSTTPWLTAQRWTRRLMADVCEGNSALKAVRHPLGFLCFPAWRGAGLGVCIHVWTENPRAVPTTSAVHAHSWDLFSIVLYGSVGNEIIDIDHAPAHPTHRLFEVRSGSDGDLMLATSELVTAQTRSRQRVRAGQAYALSAGAFHISDVPSEAVTMVLGIDRLGAPDLSLGSLSATDHRVRRTACTSTETRRIAGAVLTRLASIGPETGQIRSERVRS
ncbi:hypothetical protein [Nocardia sp. CNY236]|uniref:hypothetical protein n=1 Tax=Nocardia sp. CNY236 TaxID=1169152 RepID=UPI000419FA12|nr:hypothetical protein [Nocardia sp. CNY236]